MTRVVGWFLAVFFIMAIPACFVWLFYAFHHPGFDRVNPALFAMFDAVPLVGSLMWIGRKYQNFLAPVARVIRERSIYYLAFLVLVFIVSYAMRGPAAHR